MNLSVSLARSVFNILDGIGDCLSMLVLRRFLAREFWESGVKKFDGQNWYKLPLMYLIMLVPLLLSGPGKASIDAWIKWRVEDKAG